MKAGAVAAGLFLGFHLVAAYAAPALWWGAGPLRHLPAWGQALLILLAVAGCVPAAAAASAGGCERAWRALCGGRRIALLAAAGAALFWTFRSRNPYLGDGLFRIAELAQGNMNLRSADFLDLVVHREAWRILRAAGAQDPALAYALVSVLAGAAWIALLPALSRAVVPHPGLQWVVPATLLTAGASQLFFGYVECYTLRELAIAGYLLLALRALRGGALWPPFLLLVVGSAVHLTMLAFAPSLAALLVRERMASLSRGRLAALLAGAAAALAAALAALYLFRHQYGGLAALLPLRPDAERAYTLLSPAHLRDVANHLLLSSPAAFLWLPAGLARRRHAIARQVAAAGSGQPQAAGPRALFWLLAAGFPLALVAVIDAKLGARDWDLVALPATPLALAAIALLAGGGAPEPGPPGARPARGGRGRPDPRTVFAAACTALALFHTLPWIAVNHDPARAARAMRDLVERDPHHLRGSDPRMVNLGVQYNHQGNNAEARHYIERGVALRPGSYWGWYNLGTLEMQEGRFAPAAAALERAAALDPSAYAAANQLGVLYGRMERYPEAVAALRRATELDPAQAEGWWNLGLCLFRQERHREAIGALEAAAARAPRRSDIPYQLALAARALEDWARARAAVEATIRLDPRDARAHYLLGECFARTGDAAGARRSFLAAASLDPGGRIGQSAREVLRQLDGAASPPPEAR